MAKYSEERSLTFRFLVPTGTTDEELLYQLKSGNTDAEALIKEVINALERGEKTFLVEDENPRDTRGRFTKKMK